jgi:NADP-dependent 3-hydroxy acid dehydrogenase YdfG
MTGPPSAVVTGASSGIGRAVALRLLAGGWRVAGVARGGDRLAAVDPRLEPWPLDLADLDALPARLASWIEAHPPVDAVVSCAGRGRFGALEEFSPAQIRALVDLNFTSHALLARAFLPGMKRRGRGDLVFLGSEAALAGSRRGAVYCATKFALRGLAQALRDECGKSGVRVTVVNPGMVATSFFDDLDFAPPEEEEGHLLPADVADAVALVLTARRGAVFDEIDLSPLKKGVRFRKGDKS